MNQPYHKDIKIAVWKKAEKIKDKDPSVWRLDPYGKLMRYSNYGKNHSTGWIINHIIPQSLNGSNDIRNLQALNITMIQSNQNKK